MFECSFNQIIKHMGTKLVLENVDFSIYKGERVGIVGANGTGKTTVLRMLAGLESLKLFPGSWSPGYDYGWISVPHEAVVRYLNQIPTYPEGMTVLDVLNSAFTSIKDIEKQMRHLEAQMVEAEGDSLEKIYKKYDRLSHRYEIEGGYEMTEKLGRVCTGLSFSETFLETAYHLLSGGEKTRVELGKILIDQPDILLLDEPTNHLDTDAIEWLEEYLKAYKGIVVVVSHDRYFLDRVVNKILEIEDLQIHTYKGNYSSYVAQKEEKLRLQFEAFKDQQKRIKSMKKQIQQLRQYASQAESKGGDSKKFIRRANSIQIKLNKLDRILRPVFDKSNMRLDLTVKNRSGKRVLEAKGVTKAFEEKMLLQEVHMNLFYGERVALIGPNGCGKSTFFKILLGEISPDSGIVSIGESTKVAYLPQQFAFENEDQGVIDCFRSDLMITEGKAREYLAQFMFFGTTVFTKVSQLSGGERIRLKLAKILYHQVNLLILDEPTNHLDIDSIETLENALKDFEGTILFISHDRYFINEIAEKVIAIEQGKFVTYIGGYNAYRKQLKEKPIEHNNKDKSVKVDNKGKSNKVDSIIEQQILTLEEAIKVTSDKMDKTNDPTYLDELYREKVTLEKELESLWQLL